MLLFNKTKNILSPDVLNKVIICIGCGGARSYLENLSRCGFMNFVLFDGDVITESNVATQSVFIHEIGMLKTAAIKAHILDINPAANVMCENRFLDNDFEDESFGKILECFGYNTIRSATDFLVLGCTDNFQAQTRSSYLALKYGIPYLAAMLYERGLGAELFFMYPGITQCCPRCVWRSRYELYENGFHNNVTSDDTPIFATERMNAIKGYLTLALLGYDESDTDDTKPFSHVLNKIKNRCLVQIRLHPDINQLGVTIFDDESNKKYSFFDDTFFIPVWPDNGKDETDICELCGGSGDLRLLINKWSDTRTINTF